MIDIFDDPNQLRWHHRLLLIQGETGVWLTASPDLGVAPVDLRDHRVVPLARNSPIPGNRAAEAYIFDPMEAGMEATLVDQARQLAALLGFAVSGAGIAGAHWRVSDTAHAEFAEKVPDEVFEQEGGRCARDPGGQGAVPHRGRVGGH